MSFYKKLFGKKDPQPLTNNTIKKKNEKAKKNKVDAQSDVPEYNVEDFKIDLSKGMYVGAGLPLIGTELERRTVRPMYIDWSHAPGHTAVYGTTRVGKTRLMASMIEQCIMRGMDVLVVEPKGAVGNKKDVDDNDIGAGQETLGWITQFAEKAGRLNELKYVSPKFPKISEPFNPLFGMTNEEIASLVSTLIPADDDFFTTMGYQITFCVLVGLQAIEKSRGQEYIDNLITAEYIKYYKNDGMDDDSNDDTSSADREPADEVGKRPDIVDKVVEGDPHIQDHMIPPSRALVTLADIAKWATQKNIKLLLTKVQGLKSIDNQALSKTEREDWAIMQEEAIRALDEMANKEAGFFSKVSSSFSLILSQLSTGDLGRILCSTKINPFRDGFMDKSRGQIVMIQPFPLIFKTASDAFVRIFFSMLTSFYGNIGASGRGAPRQLALFVDEGGAVLYNGVQELFNKGGGLGLCIYIFTQSFADYKSGLGIEIAEIVNDNTNTKIFMRMNDPSSRETVAESFGIVKAEDNKYMGSKLDMRITANREDRDILLPAHMADMQKQEFLLQYGEGRYYCCAPFQPDPDILYVAPEIESERIFQKMSNQFRTRVTHD